MKNTETEMKFAYELTEKKISELRKKSVSMEAEEHGSRGAGPERSPGLPTLERGKKGRLQRHGRWPAK